MQTHHKHVTCPLCVSPQQQYGYQDEEERSLNSLDDNPAFSSRPRSRGNSLDRDRQLLQDLVSFYLTAPSSSSSSSSSPAQALSRHRGAVAAAAGFPSSFFPDLDFPLDYGEDYVSQVAQLRKQQQQDQAGKKAQQEYGALSGLDGEKGGKGNFVLLLLFFDEFWTLKSFLNNFLNSSCGKAKREKLKQVKD